MNGNVGNWFPNTIWGGPCVFDALGLQKPPNIIPLYDRGENFQKEGRVENLNARRKYAYCNGRSKRVHKPYNDRDEWPYTSIGSWFYGNLIAIFPPKSSYRKEMDLAKTTNGGAFPPFSNALRPTTERFRISPLENSQMPCGCLTNSDLLITDKQNMS